MTWWIKWWLSMAIQSVFVTPALLLGFVAGLIWCGLYAGFGLAVQSVHWTQGILSPER